MKSREEAEQSQGAELLQIEGETEGIGEVRWVTTAVAQITGEDKLPQAKVRETEREHFSNSWQNRTGPWPQDRTVSLRPTRNLKLGQGQTLKKGEGKKEKTKNSYICKWLSEKKSAVFFSELAFWTQLHNFIWQPQNSEHQITKDHPQKLWTPFSEEQLTQKG